MHAWVAYRRTPDMTKNWTLYWHPLDCGMLCAPSPKTSPKLTPALCLAVFTRKSDKGPLCQHHTN